VLLLADLVLGQALPLARDLAGLGLDQLLARVLVGRPDVPEGAGELAVVLVVLDAVLDDVVDEALVVAHQQGEGEAALGGHRVGHQRPGLVGVGHALHLLQHGDRRPRALDVALGLGVGEQRLQRRRPDLGHGVEVGDGAVGPAGDDVLGRGAGQAGVHVQGLLGDVGVVDQLQHAQRVGAALGEVGPGVAAARLSHHVERRADEGRGIDVALELPVVDADLGDAQRSEGRAHLALDRGLDRVGRGILVDVDVAVQRQRLLGGDVGGELVVAAPGLAPLGTAAGGQQRRDGENRKRPV
jgi:hypothetical protein